MWAVEFPHFTASSLESQEIKKGGENILLITMFPLKMLSTVSTAGPTAPSVAFPPWLPACSRNASLSPRLSRCSLQHDEPSTSIHCTIMSIATLPQRKRIRWGCGRTVNSTITVTVCTRCWEWYWNYFAVWRGSWVTTIMAQTPQAFQDINVFLIFLKYPYGTIPLWNCSAWLRNRGLWEKLEFIV